ncbi:class I SAM-dependent methyltransferase [Pseudochrobactrum lubricantis]|uniref:class I SAM-dependent methyltransferase n=1 Tax=Pseudochrobactrum lubricantis TaxID=558172 RepID=UPI0035D5608F
MKPPKGKAAKSHNGSSARSAGKPAAQSRDSRKAVSAAPSQGFKKPRPKFAKTEQNAAAFENAAPAAPKKVTAEPAVAQRSLLKLTGDRPQQNLPVILETSPSEDYALLDSGNSLKLEQYGPYRIIRPEAQAIWQPAWPQSEWDKADAIFTGNTDEEGMGRWHFPKQQLGETWPMALQDVRFFGRFTSFRHVGVFPEQAAHWAFMAQQVRDARKKQINRSVRVLNLFGYTGVASLIAAHAGAEVTHVDASKKAINWARENQALAGLEDKPIRWICEDATKFVAREERRGNTYDIILLDPPAYGRGPNGEVWQLFDNLPQMVDMCRAILSPDALSVVLTAYSIRASFFAIHELMRDRFTGRGGVIESGELILRERSAERALSTSMFSRWIANS